MDPKSSVTDEWIDDVKVPGNADSGKGKTFAHHVLQADGTETYTYFRYGTNDQIGNPEVSVNPTQKKSYDDAVAKATPPGGRPEININGQRMGWDPKTSDYTVPLGAVPVAPKPVEPGQVQGVPNDPTIQTQQPDGTWKTGPNPDYRPPAGAGGSMVERPDGVYIVKPDGSTVKTNLPAAPKPGTSTLVPSQDGHTYVVTVDAQGNASVKDSGLPLTGGQAAGSGGTPTPASATGWQPDMSKPDVGIFERRTAVAKMLADGVFGDPTSAAAQTKANDLLKQDLDFANTVIKNVQGIQSGEGTIYSGGIQQRGQDVQLADSRTAAATSIFNNALGQIAQLLPFAKQHSKTAGPALEALLQKGYEFQQKMGGQNTPAQVQPGPYMSRTAPIFQPNSNPTAPMSFTPPASAPAAAPQAVGAAPAPGAPMPFVPPPTGALRTAPATQGPYAPPAAAPQLTIPSLPPMSDQPRDTTGPGYPGTVPTVPSTEPSNFSDVPPSEGTGSVSQMPPGFQQLQQQGPLGGGNVLGWAQGMGFSPDVLAAFAQSRGLGGS